MNQDPSLEQRAPIHRFYPKGKASLAFFRHQSANSAASTITDGLFGTLPTGEPFRFVDLRTDIRLEIVSYGASGAYRLTESFSLGLGVSYFIGKFTSDGDIFAPTEETLPDGAFGHNLYLPEAVVENDLAGFDDSSWGVSGGFLWHLHPQWSVGGFYRQGPTFQVSVEERAGPGLDPAVPEGTLLKSDSGIPLNFPDTLGLGVAFKSLNGALTLSAEWDHVGYSSILEGLDTELVDEEAELNDANEFHMGFEYVFVTTTPVVALRFAPGGIPITVFGTPAPL